MKAKSLINQVKTDPLKITQQNGQTQTVRIIFMTYRIENDEDTEELVRKFAEGVDIQVVMPGKDCTYVVVKKAEQVKVALA